MTFQYVSRCFSTCSGASTITSTAWLTPMQTHIDVPGQPSLVELPAFNHQQVQVAVRYHFAPRRRTKQDSSLGLPCIARPANDIHKNFVVYAVRRSLRQGKARL